MSRGTELLACARDPQSSSVPLSGEQIWDDLEGYGGRLGIALGKRTSSRHSDREQASHFIY